MIKGNQLIFNFKENAVDIAVLSRGFRSVKLKRLETLVTEMGTKLETEEEKGLEHITQIRKIIKENKVLNKKVKVILSVDGIITRLIEVPVMKKKDLKGFIDNNIMDYFTVNIMDYAYDYKVIEAGKNAGDKMTVFLVVAPKVKVKYILDFMNSCDLTVEQMTIYPDAISNIFYDYKNDSMAVLDVQKDRSYITILDQRKIFLYSIITYEPDTVMEEKREEILENLGYFLNFYSSRHFGNKVSSLYLIGEDWDNIEFAKSVKEQFEIDVLNGISGTGVTISSSKDIDFNKHWDLLGASIKRRNIYNKNINFATIQQKEKKDIKNTLLLAAALLICIVTISWPAYETYYIENMNAKYDTKVLEAEISKYSGLDNKLSELTDLKAQNLKTQSKIAEIRNDEFDYLAYIDSLKKGLPKNVTLKRLSVDKENVTMDVNVKKSTLDRVKLVMAINNMNLFEHVEIDAIKLDDSEDKVSLALKIKKSP